MTQLGKEHDTSPSVLNMISGEYHLTKMSLLLKKSD